MGKLEGKVAVITGGNSGIGLATAKRFVEEGAHVVITGRREKELKEAAALIGRNVTTVTGDVTRLEDLGRLYAVVKEKHGHIDVLFANAGWGEVAPLEAATEAHFDKTFDLNVKGLFFTAQKALPLFKDGGSIILTSSVANVLGMPAFGVYAASKAAVRSFARGWTMELKDRKIRVNTVSPGPTETPALENTGLTPEQARQAAEQFVSQIPLGRRGTPPAYFTQNERSLRPALTELSVYPTPAGNEGVAVVDVRDLAEAATISLTEEGHNGKTYDLVSSEMLTGREAAATWSRLLHKQIAYAGHADFDAFEAQLREAGSPSWRAWDLRITFEGFVERGFTNTEDQAARFGALLGHPPRRYSSFAEELASEWAAA